VDVGIRALPYIPSRTAHSISAKVVINKAEIFHMKHDLGNNIIFNYFSLSLLWHFTHKIWFFTVLIFVCKLYKVSISNIKYTLAAKSVCS
jgi:hypothetical protein